MMDRKRATDTIASDAVFKLSSRHLQIYSLALFNVKENS